MPAPSANEQTVRRVLDLWNRGAPMGDQEFDALVDPDAQLDLSDRVLNPATYSGREGFRRFQREVDELWQWFRMEPEEVVASGDRVVVLVHTVGRGRQSGLEVDDRAAMIFALHEGKVRGMKVVRDRAEALRSVSAGAEAD